jgi:glycosyltransferase involved in cell wall biosynthesis
MLAFQDKFNVVWVGSIKETWHDLELIAEAANQLWEEEKGRNINFHIIGAGLSGFMAEMPPTVFYWGAERYQRLPNWLAGMQVGLSTYKPSRASLGSPLKVFDYMSSGLPFVSTEHPVAGRILEDLGVKELMIPFGDSNALAQVLVELASDRERCKRIGAAGRQLIINKYNWHQSVKDTLGAMEELLKEKGKVSKA